MSIHDQIRRVMLVDDYDAGRKLAALRLGRAGFVVTPVATADEALELARLSPPDVIVSDTHMPGMNGLELFEAIRNDPRLAGIALVLMSSGFDEGQQEWAAALGVRCAARTSDYGEVVAALRAALGATP